MALRIDRADDPLVGGLPASPAPARVPERRRVRTPGGRVVAYVEAGSGPDLVLIHGTLMQLEDMWLGPMEALSRHFRVVALDRPGHGGSDRARLIDASPWRQAEIIRDALAELGVARPILVGHSFGGAVALASAMGWPEQVRGVVALAPVCFPEPRLEQVLFGPRAVPLAGDALARSAGAVTDAVLLPALWEAVFLPQAMPARFRALFPFGSVARPSQMIAEGEDAAALWPALTRSALAYPTCRAPVTVLGGDADLVVNNAVHGQVAARLIPGARFTPLPGAGHMLHHFYVDAVVAAARAIA